MDNSDLKGIENNLSIRMLNQHPEIGPELIFRNSLHGLIADRKSGTIGPEKHTLYAVDAYEIYAWIQPQSHHLASFSMRKLSQNELSEEETQSLSDLVLEQLFFRTASGFILFDDHIDECRVLFDNISAQGNEAGTPFKQKQNKISDQEIAEFVSSIDKISNDLEHFSDSDYSKIEDFFKIWSEKFKFDFLENSKKTGRVESFRKNANYRTAGGSGERSLFNQIQKFYKSENCNIDSFESYLNRVDVQESFHHSREYIYLIMNQLSAGDKRPISFLEKAARRDADSIALARCLNRFFDFCGAPVEIEFITRSVKLHLTALLLPGRQLGVAVRHPLFTAQLHHFHPGTNKNLSDIAGQVDHTLTSLLRLRTEKISPRGGDGSINLHKRNIGKLAGDAVGQLNRLALSKRGIIARKTSTEKQGFQHALIHAADVVLDDARKESGLFEKKIRADANKTLVQSVGVFDESSGGFFERIKTQNKSRRNMYEFYVNRVFINSTKDISARYYNDKNTISIRVKNGNMPRLFFLYSDAMKNWFYEISDLSSLENSLQPCSVIIEIESITEYCKSIIDGENRLNGGRTAPSLAYLEAVLVQSILYASIGWYSTSSALLSGQLGVISERLREIGSVCFAAEEQKFFDDENNPLLPLIYKEMYLLRHYCERASAREPREQKHISDLTAGGSLKDISRAQRDLDHAVLMSEEHIRLALLPRNNGNQAAKPKDQLRGIRLAQDDRLGLVHAASWLELCVADKLQKQFEAESLRASRNNNIGHVTLLDQSGKLEINSYEVPWNELNRRYEVWMIAGIVKETEASVKRSQSQRKHLEGHPRSKRDQRFFAYLEAHGLAISSISFISLILLNFVPAIGDILNPWRRLDYGELHVFKRWNFWFEELAELEKTFHFGIRSIPLIAIFGKLFKDMEIVRNFVFSNRLNTESDRYEARQRTLVYLDEFEKEINYFYNTWNEDNIEIPEGLLYRIRPFINEKLVEIRKNIQ